VGHVLWRIELVRGIPSCDGLVHLNMGDVRAPRGYLAQLLVDQENVRILVVAMETRNWRLRDHISAGHHAAWPREDHHVDSLSTAESTTA
jgi:hypothetical protein